MQNTPPFLSNLERKQDYFNTCLPYNPSQMTDNEVGKMKRQQQLHSLILYIFLKCQTLKCFL